MATKFDNVELKGTWSLLDADVDSSHECCPVVMLYISSECHRSGRAGSARTGGPCYVVKAIFPTQHFFLSTDNVSQVIKEFQ